MSWGSKTLEYWLGDLTPPDNSLPPSLDNSSKLNPNAKNWIPPTKNTNPAPKQKDLLNKPSEMVRYDATSC